METYTAPLADFADKIKPKHILEIGFGYEGYSTQQWLGHSDAKIISVDKKDWSGKAHEFMEQYPDRFKFVEGDSKEVVPKGTGTFDLVYVDGDHTYEGAKADILNCLPKVKVGGYLLIDDYGVNYGVTDLDELGRHIEAEYGVKQATDEILADNESWVLQPDTFANGGRAYARVAA